MGGAGSNRPAPRLCQLSRDPWRQLLDARRPPWLSPGVKKPGPGPHGDAPDVTSGARRYTAAMKWQRHEDGDIILAVVIICALAGLAWLARWWWCRILVRAFDRGYSLGLLRGCTQRLGRRTGCNLEDYGGLRDFMDMYEERVANSELPESPELRRTVFRPDPDGTPRMHERLCERLRVAATAMWYVMGTMGQADAQEELKAALYDLYEKHGKSVDGLRDELGDRD